MFIPLSKVHFEVCIEMWRNHTLTMAFHLHSLKSNPLMHMRGIKNPFAGQVPEF